jgi:hypothetical protein
VDGELLRATAVRAARASLADYGLGPEPAVVLGRSNNTVVPSGSQLVAKVASDASPGRPGLLDREHDVLVHLGTEEAPTSKLVFLW